MRTKMRSEIGEEIVVEFIVSTNSRASIVYLSWRRLHNNMIGDHRQIYSMVNDPSPSIYQ